MARYAKKSPVSNGGFVFNERGDSSFFRLQVTPNKQVDSQRRHNQPDNDIREGKKGRIVKNQTIDPIGNRTRHIFSVFFMILSV